MNSALATAKMLSTLSNGCIVLYNIYRKVFFSTFCHIFTYQQFVKRKYDKKIHFIPKKTKKYKDISLPLYFKHN